MHAVGDKVAVKTTEYLTVEGVIVSVAKTGGGGLIYKVDFDGNSNSAQWYDADKVYKIVL